MLWWGSSGKFFNLGSLGNRPCGTCEKDRNFSLMLAYRVHHLWFFLRWITGKTYTVACDICGHGHVADAKEIESVADKHPVPWFDRFGWTIGAGLVGLIAVVGVVGDKQNKAEDAGFLMAPHVGDIYKVDFAKMVTKPEAPVMYSAMRIREVGKDTVTFDLSKGYFDRLKGIDSDFNLRKVDAADYYGGDPVTIPTAALSKFRDEGTIMDIERK
jgi:hypothetical protein